MTNASSERSNAPLPCHYQDARDYCGPASAMMILEYCGIPLLPETGGTPGMFQSDLWSLITSATAPQERYIFASAPDGMVAALNHFMTDSADFVLFSSKGTPDNDPLVAVCRSLEAGPVLLLIRAGSHWGVAWQTEGAGFLVSIPVWRPSHSAIRQYHGPPPCPACPGAEPVLLTRDALMALFLPVRSGFASQWEDHFVHIGRVPDTRMPV